MSTPRHDPEDNDLAGISDALRRDALRITEPAFDGALHRAVMDRIREISEAHQPHFRFGFIPSLAVASATVTAAMLIYLFLFPSRPPSPNPVAASPILRKAPPITSVWSYEIGLKKGDAVLDGMLDHDAQSLLPPSPNSLDGLL